MITKARHYHSLSDQEKLNHWKQAQRPSRWPQFLAALSYAEKLIEVYDFEACDWVVLTEKPGHVFGSAMCYMQGQLMSTYTQNGVALISVLLFQVQATLFSSVA